MRRCQNPRRFVDIVGPSIQDVVRETLAARGGLFSPAEPFVPSGDACGSIHSQSNVNGTVAQCAVAISIRDVSIDVVGTHPRDVVVPLRGAPSSREAERGVGCRVAFLPAEPFVTPEDA